MANVHSVGQCNLRAFPCCKTWDIKITETPFSFIRQEGLRWCVSSLGANHILEAFCQKLPNSPAPFCRSLSAACPWTCIPSTSTVFVFLSFCLPPACLPNLFTLLPQGAFISILCKSEITGAGGLVSRLVNIYKMFT